MSHALQRLDAKQRHRASRDLAQAVLAQAPRARLLALAERVVRGSEGAKHSEVRQ